MSVAFAASAQQADITAYEHTPYPAVVHPMTHPDRLAVLARLAGVAAPDLATARVLDIGCANGLNILALAAAYPEARFVGVDLVPEAIERGAALAGRAGLNNVELKAADFTAPGAIEGPFDYVIAHGLLAWVTPELGEALFALIARILSPTGVAFVSFNALPGSHIRTAMRDAMLFAMRGEDDPAPGMRAARAMLERIGADRAEDDLTQRGYRARARFTAETGDAVLWHDELARHFTPRYLTDVAALAGRHGLDWLGDTRRDHRREGFSAEEPGSEGGESVLRAAQAADFDEGAMFRAACFVRAEAQRRWTPDLAALAGLHALSVAHEVEPGQFARGGEAFRIVDDQLAAALRTLVSAHPRRVPVAALGLGDEQLAALLALDDLGVVSLHTTAEPFAVEVGEAPVVSPLIRVMLADGEEKVPTLDHSMLTPTGTARDMLLALDGSGRSPAFRAAVAAAGFESDRAVDDALGSIAALGVLVR